VKNGSASLWDGSGTSRGWVVFGSSGSSPRQVGAIDYNPKKAVGPMAAAQVPTTQLVRPFLPQESGRRIVAFALYSLGDAR